MSPLLTWAVEWVSLYGPWVVFLMTFVETGFMIGLVIPAGPTIVFGCVLAVQGNFDFALVVLATLSGGFLGDNLGFFWGRRAGRHVLEGQGRFGRAAQKHWGKAEELFGRHPVYAVSFARLISFVRTLMPIAAGTSHLTYRAFVFYDILGVLAWGSAHLILGYLAGESWQQMVSLMGAGWAVIFAVMGAVLYVLHKRKKAAGGPVVDSADPAAEGPS